jgi:peptidoglycan/xylan/chitin deacetylase (PgdA/CDA1 family)
MSLLVLMYHRARAGRFGNSPEMLDEHFAHLASTYPTGLPGDTLAPGALNVCLSFDDGYFDFYAIIFPLLKKHNLLALLAIPPRVVQERVSASASERLAVESDAAFANPDNGGFCTWPELAEMAASGHVAIAAHGATHRRLDQPMADLAFEVTEPKAVLASRLGQPVDSFVFPFGRYSPAALVQAQSSYRHVFRIGGALNRGHAQQLLYRVDADEMESPVSLFSARRLAGYRARYYWNRLRRR